MRFCSLMTTSTATLFLIEIYTKYRSIFFFYPSISIVLFLFCSLAKMLLTYSLETRFHTFSFIRIFYLLYYFQSFYWFNFICQVNSFFFLWIFSFSTSIRFIIVFNSMQNTIEFSTFCNDIIFIQRHNHTYDLEIQLHILVLLCEWKCKQLIKSRGIAIHFQ